MDTNRKQELADLLMRTGQGHHRAFIKSDGFDPEWPLWYSDQLKDELPKMLGVDMTRSRIIYELIHLDDTVDTSKEHWTQVYAGEMLKKYT